MHAKEFLAISLLCFVSILVTYAWVVDRHIIIDRDIPYSYRQFVFETASPIKGKVIIDSGSNSTYSINPFELSKYFNAPVFTVADNAAYPLRQKIFKIKKFAQEGDVVILPLEWGYYTRPEPLTSFFLSGIADKELRLEHYFNSMPWFEKLTFIFRQYPLHHVINGLKVDHNKHLLMQHNFERLSYFEKLAKSNSYKSFGNLSDNGPKTIDKISRAISCDKYIYDHSFAISNVFKSNLALMKTLTDKGVRVYFTSPAVVDSKYSKCYQNVNIKNFTNKIKAVIEKEGFQFIGNYEQSHFPSNCFLDTYYHITGDCATTRTRTLIKEIQKSHIPKINSGISQNNLIALVNNNIRQNIFNQAADLINHLSAVDIENINNNVSFTQMLFPKGWHTQEKWGVWSKEKESIILFKISNVPAKSSWIKLRIKGMYFNGKEKTGITINGASLGAHDLTDKAVFIPGNLISNNKIIDIRLNHTSVVSPAELNVSNDPRKIKFGMTSIEVKQTHIKQ